MSKTIQIRHIDDEVYATLKSRAAQENLSVPEFLRREVERIASRPSMREWLERVSRRPINHEITPEHVLEALDEIRGPWPSAGS